MGKPPLPIPSPLWDSNGIRMGLQLESEWGPMPDLTGLAHAHAIPTVPMVADVNPTWDWTGLAIWAHATRHMQIDHLNL